MHFGTTLKLAKRHQLDFHFGEPNTSRGGSFHWDQLLISFSGASSLASEHLSLIPDVPGRAHREDAFIPSGQQHPFQKSAALIVKEVFKPSALHEFGNDDDYSAGGMPFRKIEDELNDRNDDEAVGGWQEMKGRRLLAGRAKGLEGNQQSEGRFRTIRSRAQPVEAKNWDALRRTNLFGALVLMGLPTTRSSMFMRIRASTVYVRKSQGPTYDNISRILNPKSSWHITGTPSV